MESRAKLLGHPVHQMLVPIPAGLFIVAVLLDIIGRFSDVPWIPVVSFWNIVLGSAGALLAAVFGLLDWTKIPGGTRAKRVGAVHAGANVAALSLFVGAVWLRIGLPSYEGTTTTLALEIGAFALLSVAAWLGGELVDRLGVGVHDGAHLDAPNSLRAKHVNR